MLKKLPKKKYDFMPAETTV